MHAPANRKIHPDRNLISGRAEECGCHWGNEGQTVVWSLFQNS